MPSTYLNMQSMQKRALPFWYRFQCESCIPAVVWPKLDKFTIPEGAFCNSASASIQGNGRPGWQGKGNCIQPRSRSAMPEYELFYWPITGLGEPIRLPWFKDSMASHCLFRICQHFPSFPVAFASGLLVLEPRISFHADLRLRQSGRIRGTFPGLHAPQNKKNT